RDAIEVYLSNRIFQVIEDFLSTVQYDLTGAYVWLNIFFMWMRSPILQKNWSLLAHCYTNDTRELVNRIIEKSNYLNELSQQRGAPLLEQDYDAISHSFPFKPR